MAVYYSIKCPHCKKVVESGKDRSVQYGSPFRKCPYCGYGYLDKNYIEPGVIDEADLHSKKYAWGGLLYVLFGGFFIFLSLYGRIRYLFLIVGIGTVLLGIFATVNALKSNPKEDKELNKQLAESRKRLSDPHYVIALWKAECQITPELLTWAKKEIDKEKIQ